MADFEEDTIPGLEDANVVTKYKLAGEMAGRVLNKVKDACVAGAKVMDLCQLGDDSILAEVKTVYNKKDADTGLAVPKGIAFPTCICINNCICHCSPIATDKEIIVADGDVVKIDLAVHLDGFIAPIATTFVVGETQVTGRKADVILAAHQAAEVALRMLKIGAKNYDITDAVTKVAESYKCKAVEGMLSHQLIKNKIDCEKAIISNPTEQLRKEHKASEILENEVYALDIIISTGEGKTREGEARTTVFKKTETTYQLKMKSARAFYTEVAKNNACMPFTLRQFEDEKTARLGVIECVKHEVLDAYKILWEKDGELVAQVKMLVLIMPNGTIRGSENIIDPAMFKSEHTLEDEGLLALLKTQVGNKNKKKKKKKAAAKTDGGDKAEVAK